MAVKAAKKLAALPAPWRRARIVPKVTALETLPSRDEGTTYRKGRKLLAEFEGKQLIWYPGVTAYGNRISGNCYLESELCVYQRIDGFWRVKIGRAGGRLTKKRLEAAAGEIAAEMGLTLDAARAIRPDATTRFVRRRG